MTRAARIAQVLLVLAIGVILWLALSANPPRAAGLFDFDKLNHLAAFFVLALLTEYAFPSATVSALKLAAIAGFWPAHRGAAVLGRVSLFRMVGCGG